MVKNLVVLVGPPGCGKSTLAHKLADIGFARISQDDQGKDGHRQEFMEAIRAGKPVVVDRMNFDAEQRSRYLSFAKENGYHTCVKVIHESMETCLERISKRESHPTIKTEKDAKNALNFFFSKYTRPTKDEADVIEYIYPEGHKEEVIICDLDGTLCNIDHRLHFLHAPKDQPEGVKFKKDWKSFSESCVTDKPNDWCMRIIEAFEQTETAVIFASGRSDEYKGHTVDWLMAAGLHPEVYMRNRSDYRQDCIVKENILDFEILTRYNPIFFIDDRKQVTDMWRARGYVCLQCAEGEF